MTSISVVGLAFALSADAFAATVSKGVQCRDLSHFRRLAIAVSFAVMETLAPVVGWLAGREFGHLIAAWDHWVAFGILAFLGVRMIRQGTRPGAAGPPAAAPGFLALFALTLGTSVDAASVGITFALVSERILPAIAAVATVTFIMAWMGLHIGRLVGTGAGRIVETFGGLILIGLGLKVLYAHLVV